jgi:hypothetical protein
MARRMGPLKANRGWERPLQASKLYIVDLWTAACKKLDGKVCLEIAQFFK